MVATIFEDLTPEMLQDLTERIKKYSKDFTGFEDFEDVFEYIRDSGDNKETTDSCYIYATYKLKTKNFVFSVSGSSYRKDQSVCDQEMDEGIEILSLVEIDKEKNKKKLKEKAASDKKWEALFTKCKTKEDVMNAVKELTYPKGK